MSRSNKIILFIVEGETDEISLALILSKLVGEKLDARFKLVRTDITTRKDVDATNIISKLTEEVKYYIKEVDYNTKKDILRVIHIIDTDGAFIDDRMIEQGKTQNIIYNDDKIIVHNKEHIISLHDKKKHIVNRIISLPSIYDGIEYSVYYFSRNLEHVLHEKPNCVIEEKEKLAYEFEDTFSEQPQRFIEFINNHTFAVSGNYKETWDFIKSCDNSLKRYSNFHLYINSL